MSLVAVYPRWRGELAVSPAIAVVDVGLSPLARGTLEFFRYVSLHIRFIPAGAGNSTNPAISVIIKPVYPRWRGELCACAERVKNNRGLSPLARGTPSCRVLYSAPTRFIPAGAGNSIQTAQQTMRLAVYPRWRGELAFWLHPPPAQLGLSPLARGTRSRSNRHTARHRFIPAGAGNSEGSSHNMYGLSVYPRWRGGLLPKAR